jgi:hypothetical protein
MHNKSHYDTLHVSRNAKSAAITEAYEHLVKKCREELRPNADASRYLKAIAEAHAVLVDPEQRAAYDVWLQEQELAKSGSKQSSAPSMAGTESANTVNTSRQNKPPTPPVAMVSDDAGTNANRPRIAFAAVSALVLAGVIGFFMFRSGSEAPKPATTSDGMSSGLPVMDDSAIAAALAPPAVGDSKTSPVTEITIPKHDVVTIDKLLGLWQGNTDYSGRWRKLDVRRKSDDSFVFQLDSKSGDSIGEVYGVASFRDGYALFFNEEYGCSMVFTMKSDALNLTTSGCQAYHGQGAGFDGPYGRPQTETSRKTAASTPSKPRQVTAKDTSAPVSATPAPMPSQAAPAANPGKLYRFVATIKNAEGKTERIELVAANEEAARAILRDFRGNPTVVRIRRAWF